jgi:hypothetical protein
MESEKIEGVKRQGNDGEPAVRREVRRSPPLLRWYALQVGKEPAATVPLVQTGQALVSILTPLSQPCSSRLRAANIRKACVT